MSDLSDVLFAQIEFQQAYQDYIDYENLCRIVTQAKSSVENVKFASKLLNANIYNIDVSTENIVAIFVSGWVRFCQWWGKVLDWFISLFKKSKSISKQNETSETKDKISVKLQFYPFHLENFTKALDKIQNYSNPDNTEKRDLIAENLSDITLSLRDNKLFTPTSSSSMYEYLENAEIFVNTANKTIAFLNKHIKSIKADAHNRDESDRTSTKAKIKNYGSEKKWHEKCGHAWAKAQDLGDYGAARYLMKYLPQIVQRVLSDCRKIVQALD